jgi:hypothetical protein
MNYKVPAPIVSALPGNAGNFRDAANTMAEADANALTRLTRTSVGGKRRKSRRRYRGRGGGTIEVNMPQVLFKDPSANSSQSLTNQITQLTNSSVTSEVNSHYDSLVGKPKMGGAKKRSTRNRRGRRRKGKFSYSKHKKR